jgi:hypothetical protein
MGIMICKVHGEVGFVETCSHVANKIAEGNVPAGRRFTILGNLFICDECFDSLGFERSISLADLPPEESVQIVDGRWDAFEAAYEAIEGRRAFCLKCLAELDGHQRSRMG